MQSTQNVPSCLPSLYCRAHACTQIHRVPNDGDCFFSSIKAALEAGNAGCQGGWGSAATEAVAAAELTVAQMREWVAEETGEDQLEFYSLQAKAHPEDRWWVQHVALLM